MSVDDKMIAEIPKKLPMLPVRDIVVFPYMILPLYVGRGPSIKAVEEALANNRLIFLSTQKEVSLEHPQPNDIYETGTVAMIMRMRKLSDGRVKVLVQGLSKAQVVKFKQAEPFFEVEIKKLKDPEVSASAVEHEALIKTAKTRLEQVIALGRVLSPDILLVLEDINDPGRVADLIASNLGIKTNEAQKILETSDPKERLSLVNDILDAEIQILQLQSEVSRSAKDEANKSQREYFLKEQMKAIKSELGENGQEGDDTDELRERLERAGMPEEAKKEAFKQYARFSKMHPDSSEASMIRTYLDWMADLPWNESTEDIIDLKESQALLDSEHFGLEKAKDRILEFLAVRKLKQEDVSRGPILCLVGPPGVGKTSLGKSIAKAMGRKYHRIALGGVKDEAEIRGHRRTYVGAMPGKIVQALKTLKTNNPVVVLDEVDKLGSDFRGDPSAAMLEVLDPEQNSAFRDNYLNVDFDLSKTLFLATANVLSDIPPALRDRMEVISISGYTLNDKITITRDHLIDRQIEEAGIKPENIEFTDEGLHYLVAHYTREAGVRNLGREVGSVCRKVAKNIVMGDTEKVIVTPEKIVEFLGAPRFTKEERMKEDQVGVVTGLAWTQAGGEILFVEALKMKGKGGLKLTGQLGDVMKESAEAAMSYARAHSKELGIADNWFDENQVHIHLPAGAIPKDGPSAGVTLSSALLSVMLDKPLRSDLAMTGEISLSGRVMPVGGIKEKALAALNQGITNIMLPMQNKKDLEDIPQELKDKINFIFVENLDEVFSVVFAKDSSGPISIDDNSKDKSSSEVGEVAA